MGELDQYSAKPSSIGLQACASSRTAHGGVTGNADHEDEVSLSFAHHHYVESVIKRYTVALVIQLFGRLQSAVLDGYY